jgi:hypothetical protein
MAMRTIWRKGVVSRVRWEGGVKLSTRKTKTALGVVTVKAMEIAEGEFESNRTG